MRRQAVAKLLANAGSHTPPRLAIEIDAEYKNEQLLISVSDRGPGVSIEAADRLFEKFYRAGDPLVHNTKGSGLGLSLVRHITEAHGGEIAVESAPGTGSKFTLSLPLAPANALSPATLATVH